MLSLNHLYLVILLGVLYQYKSPYERLQLFFLVSHVSSFVICTVVCFERKSTSKQGQNMTHIPFNHVLMSTALIKVFSCLRFSSVT